MSMTAKEVQIQLWDDNPVPLKLQQYEDEGRTLRFTLWDRLKPFDLTGRTVHFSARKPDGKIILNPCTVVDAEQGVCEYVVTAQTVVVSGEMDVQIHVRKAGTLLITRALLTEVLPSVNWQDKVSEDEIGTVTDLLSQAYEHQHFVLNELATQGYLPLSGGQMVGAIGGLEEPTIGNQAANKTYVDDNTNNKLPIAGGTMTGPITMADAPTAKAHLANKFYVDNRVITASTWELLPASYVTLQSGFSGEWHLWRRGAIGEQNEYKFEARINTPSGNGAWRTALTLPQESRPAVGSTWAFFTATTGDLRNAFFRRNANGTADVHMPSGSTQILINASWVAGV